MPHVPRARGPSALEALPSVLPVSHDGANYPLQKAVPHMPEGSRIILNSTSINGASTVTPNYLLYCSTKGAVEQMTRVLSKDLVAHPRHITVNCVAPGPTATELFLKGKPGKLSLLYCT